VVVCRVYLLSLWLSAAVLAVELRQALSEQVVVVVQAAT
jgi:hypothetical protein